MKKFTFLFALCAMLFLNVGIAKAETATISYAGETTNMTGNNDATLVGLDASLWSVVSDKGSANNHVGLNKAGNIRLYAHKDSGNGNILTVSISQGTIEKITLDILQEATYEVKVAGNIVAATEETTYFIGATSFSIQNITSGASTQLQLNSITITYSSTGEGGTTPEEPETPTLPEGAITCAEAAVIAAADGYVGTEDVTVYGYVVELGNAKADGSKQCFYMSDTKGGAKQFMAYWAFVPQLFVVGDYVTVTGPLKNYQGTIEIVDGYVIRNGVTIQEDYVAEQGLSGEMNPVIVEEGKVFVMGDNRRVSQDSRSSAIGQVDQDTIIGKVVLRIYPFTSIKAVTPRLSRSWLNCRSR